MNLQNDPHRLALMKFGIGQPVTRTEDPILVRGAGCYTDDMKLAGEAHAVIVRSRIAHGVLKCIVPFNNRDGTPMKRPPRPALPTDKVRFVGDPIAFVVAETLLQAKDAAEAVEVDIDPLPAVTNPEEAVRPGAPTLYDEAPDNIALDFHYGDA